MPIANLFISCVSAEFEDYREALQGYLTRSKVSVSIQENFTASGSVTLDKLDEYLRACDGVVHLVGDMTGALAGEPSVALIRQRYPDIAQRLPVLAPFLVPGAPGLPYTQWEAWLALFHGKRLIVCAPEAGALRDERFVLDEAQRSLQQEHVKRLREAGRHVEFRFANADRLALEVLRSPIGDLVPQAQGAPRNLPRQPNRFFTGRDGLLRELVRALGEVPRAAHEPTRWCVLSGLGGAGKSSLALEHAWAQGPQHSALLWVEASDGAALNRTLAALSGPRVLNLAEHEATDQGAQVAAVRRWLAAHPGWLLVADNVDSEAAAQALEDAGEGLAGLAGGHVVVTSRLSPEAWGAHLPVLLVREWSDDDAAAFLLARTQGQRRARDDDGERAHTIAAELGGLPLAIEQAGAYVARRKLTFEAYQQAWAEQREQVLAWYDPRVMAYPRSLATTWRTSVAQLSPAALRLLQRLAWLAPEPVPESLLDVRVGDDDAVADGPEALAELAGLSLVRRDESLPQFTMHRLMQEVTRLGLREDAASEVMGEALAWLVEGFVGDPDNVHDWPQLEPLLPHVLTVAEVADNAAWAGLVSGLLDDAGVLLRAKARWAEAERLMRRALSLAEASQGREHPMVAIRLNNLALLLQDTDCLEEAELLLRRALSIDEVSHGPDHTNVALRLNNLAQLLSDTQWQEAEALMWRALRIDERAWGADHSNVAVDLNNLAELLRGVDRFDEAEPLIRRALVIDEACHGSDHPNVARDLGNLALLLQGTDRVKDAEPLMRRALRIMEARYEPEHPKVALHLFILAALLQATGRGQEAEPLMRRACLVFARSLGPRHPRTHAVWENYAVLLESLGEDVDSQLQRLVADLGPALAAPPARG